MMGAGGSADPFWDLYAVHKEEHVLKLLEKYRIGERQRIKIPRGSVRLCCGL